MAAAKRKPRAAYEEELQGSACNKIDDICIDLTKTTIAQANARTKDNAQNTNICFKLDHGTTYFLNDKTIKQLLKKIEDERMLDGNRKDNEYQNLVTFQPRRNPCIFSEWRRSGADPREVSLSF